MDTIVDDRTDGQEEPLAAFVAAWHEPIPDDAPEWQKDRLFADVLDRIEHRYRTVEPEPCRVCGAELTIASVGGAGRTLWRCSVAGRGGSGTDWDHHMESRWIEPTKADPEVVALVAAVRDALRQGADQ